MASRKKEIIFSQSSSGIPAIRELDVSLEDLNTSVGKVINFSPLLKVDGHTGNYTSQFTVNDGCLRQIGQSSKYIVGPACSGKTINYNVSVTDNNQTRQASASIHVAIAENRIVSFLPSYDKPEDGSSLEAGGAIDKKWGFKNVGTSTIKNIKITPTKKSRLDAGQQVVMENTSAWLPGQIRIFKLWLSNAASNAKSEMLEGEFTLEHNSDGKGYVPLKFRGVQGRRLDAYGTYVINALARGSRPNSFTVRISQRILPLETKLRLIATPAYPVDRDKVKININGVVYPPKFYTSGDFYIFRPFPPGDYSGQVILSDENNRITASESFSFTIESRLGRISDLSPRTATKDQPQTFTITGSNFPTTVAFTFDHCNDATTKYISASLATYRCTPRQTGIFTFIGKMQSLGTPMIDSKKYTVEVSEATVVHPLKGAGKLLTDGEGKPKCYFRAKNRCAGSLPIHVGVDLMINAGHPVYSMCNGRVHSDHTNRGVDNSFLIVEHNCNGSLYYGYYGHISSELETNASVSAGDKIGKVKNDGNNSHLHMAIATEYHSRSLSDLSIIS